jgi:hypothetical protein
LRGTRSSYREQSIRAAAPSPVVRLGHPDGQAPRKRPIIVFDVNETLLDLSRGKKPRVVGH